MDFRRTCCFGFLATIALSACGGDDTAAGDNTTDAAADGATADGATADGSNGDTGSDVSMTTGDGGTEAGEASAAGDAAVMVARGDYIVNHVGACADCHTPRKMDGSPDTTKWLAGNTVPFADLVPGDDTQGNVYVRNLTPDKATGLGNWTDDQIKTAFLDGKDKDGKALFPIMPYFVFHNMSAADADAVVAYLRSIPAVANVIPPNQPPASLLPAPANAIDKAVIPNTTLKPTDTNYQSALRGRYLAAEIGVCMECHTKHLMGADVLDKNAFFAGNEEFPAASLGLMSPPWPMSIYSANITPHESGIKGFTAIDVAKVLKQGIDAQGRVLCPPMPVGPMGAFGGLTDSDAIDIGNYITTLPPIANAGIAWCSPPPPPPGDAGATDAADAAQSSDSASTSDAASGDAASGDAATE